MISQYLFIFFLAIGVVIVIGLWYFVQYYNTRMLLDFTLLIENPEVGRGENLKFKIGLKPSQDIAVNRIVTKLKCVERDESTYNQNSWGWGNRTNLGDMILDYFLNRSGAADHVVAEYDGEVQGGNFTFKKGESREFEGEMQVPGDALHTKLEGNLQVRWYLGVIAHLPSPPPASAEREFQVVYKYPKPAEVSGDASQLFNPHQPQQPPAPSDSISHLELDRGQSPDTP